ncbi:hypothetical protein VSAK1_14137 [Vibrio mediterranei AK1]|nr:hypothetical protein VSAK1_14137 [Vibrio mediterranei AK1]
MIPMTKHNKIAFTTIPFCYLAKDKYINKKGILPTYGHKKALHWQRFRKADLSITLKWV